MRKIRERRKPFANVGLLRDPVTEGYDVIPNFFISATLDKSFDYDKPKLKLHPDAQGGEWTGDQIKHTHPEFAKVEFPTDQLYHVWDVDEV